MPDNGASEVCLALDETMLTAIGHPRLADHTLGALARELGLSWQRLWGILHSLAAGEASTPREALPELRPSPKASPEK